MDVGAGVGRVTCDVLLHLVSDVVLLEPVSQFIQEALQRCRSSAADPALPANIAWKGIANKTKSVTFIQGTLQAFDAAKPLISGGTRLDRVGFQPSEDDLESGFDVVWCQWCLGHLSDPDLVEFFRKSRLALRESPRSLIVVKENVCSNHSDGSARSSFDEEDSSLTRYESHCRHSH